MNPADQLLSANWDPQSLGWFLLKMLLSFGLGWFLGGQRGARQPVAGVRTHMVVACGSCLVSVCGEDLLRGAPGGGDATRLAGQILTGIGFIGAGAIISRGVGVMTTAATIFFAAAVGISCGLGFLTFAVLSTLIVVAGLSVTERLFPQEELPGRNLKIVCLPDKLSKVCDQFKGRIRLNSIVKRDDYVELFLHFADLSWAELDKLVDSVRDNPDIIAIQLIDYKGGF